MTLRRVPLVVSLLLAMAISFVVCRKIKEAQRKATRPAPPPAQPVRASIEAPPAVKPAVPNTVRVAAIQCYSRMGKISANRELLTTLVTDAAAQGARIVVLPECAVQGYMDVPGSRTWSSADEAEMPVKTVAETVPGSSTRHFGSLAAKLRIYLALPLIETADERCYNALVLLGPDGKIVARHRKHALWAPGDASWATASDAPITTIATPYGRLGLMICFDVHALPPQLAKARADIVLYAVGWYGPNTENWYRDVFPRRYVVPHGFAVVAANWAAEPGTPAWDGAGYSCVIGRDGSVLAMAAAVEGTEIVLADLPLPPNAEVSARPEPVSE
jgi:predicted amidohydrolase